MELGRSLIVVHGVGDTTQGECGERLTDALASSLLPRAVGHTAVRVARLDDAILQPPTPPGVARVRTTTYQVSWRDPKQGRLRLPIYEFYWGDDTRAVPGLMGRVWGVWQLTVGLPRLGLRVLDGVYGFAGRAARSLYYATWFVLVARLIVNLWFLGVAIVAAYLRMNLSPRVQIGASLALDLSFSLLCLLLLGCLAVCLIAGPPAIRPAYSMALIALAAAWLLTQVVPLAIQSIKPETVAASSLAGLPPEDWVFRVLGHELDARWFYAPHTFAGFWPYFSLSLVMGGAGLFACLYLGVRLSSKLGKTAGATEGLLRASWRWGLLVAANILLVSPVLDCYTLGSLLVGREPYYLAESSDVELINALRRYAQFITYPFIAMIAGFLVSSQWQAILSPPVKLAQDMLTYFPARAWLDEVAVLRYLFGGRRSPRTHPSLEDELRDRLRTLIVFANKEHGGPVLLVGHSLGSIIALTALDGWAHPGMRIHLVTLGSPLVLLATTYPHVYGPLKAGRWSLASVRSWTNLYRWGDVIGREVGPSQVPAALPPTSTFREDDVGSGGHPDYFHDAKVADCLARII